jgi:hypothetical protein
MKNPVYIFVNYDSLSIISNALNAQISFEKQEILNITEEIIASLIWNKLNDLGLDTDNLIIILSEDFYDVNTKLKSCLKKENSNKEEVCLKQKNIFKSNSLNKTHISSYSEYLYQGQVIRDFSALPLLQQYYISESYYIQNENKIGRLQKALGARGVSQVKYIPYTEFASGFVVKGDLKNKSGRNIAISLHRNKCYISEYRGLFIKSTEILNYGLDRIVLLVSNKFNVSFSVALKLVKTYGFVFLPAKFVNFVIEVPVYDDINVNVDLPELSFVIREGVRQLFSDLLLHSDLIDLDSITLYSSFAIKGVFEILGLITNKEICTLNFEGLNSEQIENAIDVIFQVETESRIQPIQDSLSEISIEQSQGLRNKFTALINSHIKPWLVDADVL